ncbi:protein disulfide-isomerase a6 [Anaeramoeba ignava]|uniref:protein disulfide-isomerase n=1 Tax=Anaeramoeba ignava TaxID=1746090 RepID=A0A9Q0LFB9_ANAIG|nr:protein disulfide-isomerase a6 [Anaeramoeba ignava]
MKKITIYSTILFLFLITKTKTKTETKDVIELNYLNFDSIVLKNYDQDVFVVFAAEWCPHCQKLMPEWNKAASTLKGLIIFGHVDSSDQVLNQKYQIKGFPTIKLFKHTKEGGVKEVIDYNGQREFNSLKNFALSFLESYVVDLQNVDQWISSTQDRKKVVLFPSSKFNDVPPLFKGLSRDFRGDLGFGVVFQNNPDHKYLMQMFGVDNSPKIVILDKNGSPISYYSGKTEYKQLKKYLSSFVSSTSENFENFENENEQENEQENQQENQKNQNFIHQMTNQNYQDICFLQKKGLCVILTLSEFNKNQNEEEKISLFEQMMIKLRKDPLFKSFSYINFLESDIDNSNDFMENLGDITDLSKNHELFVINPKKSKMVVFEGKLEDELEVYNFLDHIISGEGKFISLNKNQKKEL